MHGGKGNGGKINLTIRFNYENYCSNCQRQMATTFKFSCNEFESLNMLNATFLNNCLVKVIVIFVFLHT